MQMQLHVRLHMHPSSMARSCRPIWEPYSPEVAPGQSASSQQQVASRQQPAVPSNISFALGRDRHSRQRYDYAVLSA